MTTVVAKEPSSQGQDIPAFRSRPRVLTRVAVWLFLVISAALIRIPHMTESLWFDEVWRTDVVLRGGGIKDLLLHDVHNPLYNVFMYAWTGVFGDSEWAIRTPSLLFGLGTILVVARWMSVRLDPRSAMLCAGILLLSPVHAWYSCEAKNNMMVVFLTSLAVVQADALATRGTWSSAAWMALWSTLSVLTSWQAVLMILPAWLGAAWLIARPVGSSEGDVGAAELRSKWMFRLAVSAAGTLLALLPLIIFKASRVEELQRWYVRPFDLPAFGRLVLIWLPTGNALVRIRGNDWVLWGAVFSVAVVPALLFGLRALLASSAGRMVLLCTIFPGLVLLLITWACIAVGAEPPRLYQERNVLVVLPWYMATLAYGAVRAGVLSRILPALLIGLSLASSIAAVTWRSDKPTVMFPNPDWRAAASFIKEAGRQSGREAVVVSCCPLLPMKYYLEGPPTLIEVDWNTDVAAVVDGHRRAHPAADVFFINNPCWFGHPSDELASLEARLGYVRCLKVTSLEVYLLPSP